MNKLLAGINTDVGPIDQPQGTYRDALNMLHGKRKGAMSTEEGNTLRDSVDTGYTIIGHTLIYDGTFVVFLAGKDGTAQAGNSEIGTFDGTTYTTVISSSLFNFDPDSDLQCVSIINNKEEIVVYWTDDINPPRYYNITRNEGFDDILETRLFPSVDIVPTIDFTGVDSAGGSIVTGAYHFAVRLVAEDGSTTSYMAVTPPIYVNDETDVSDHDNYDGAEAGIVTSKAINFIVDNIDQSYESLDIAVIRKENNTIAEVNLLPRRSISGDSSSITYTGNETTIETSLDEVVINTASYATAKTIIESDNTLYLGNLSSQEDIGYQPFANNIVVESITKDVDDGGTGLFNRDHYGNATIAYYDKSFKRGEVYAFYLSFVLSNGSETPAYHIPGRESEGTEKNFVSEPSILDIDGVTDTENYNYEFFSEAGTNGMAFWENKNETYPSLAQDEDDNWKIMDVDSNGDVVDTGNTLHGENVRHHHFPEYDNEGYEFYEGSDNTDYAKALGVQFNNIKIPSNVIDRIRGVKIYYAKRTAANKRIIDQGFLRAGAARQVLQPVNTAWVPTKGDQNNGGNGFEFVTFNGFNSIRNKTNIGDISYIKSIIRPKGDATRGDGDGDDDVFYDQTMNYETIALVDKFRAIKNGTGKTYLQENSYMEQGGSGFTYDIDNRQGEESIGFELDRALDMSMSTDPDGVDESVGHIAEICAVREDLYNSFDLQELIWTGITDVDIDKFDPRFTGSGADVNAEGSIEVTSGSGGGEGGSPSTVTFGVDSGEQGSCGDPFTLYEITINFDGIQTIVTDQPIGGSIQDIIDELNADHTDWTWAADGTTGSFENITGTHTTNGDNNGLELTSSITDESGGTELCVDGEPPSTTMSDFSQGGVDTGSIDDLIIEFGGETFNVTVPASETPANIASLINDEINASSTNYSSTLASATVTITADDPGAEFNTVITVTEGNTEIEVTTDNIDGGSSADPGDLFVLGDVYGGDIFIVPHGTKRTVRDDAYNGLTSTGIYRHLVYYVCESTDNIKLRHEGEGFDIYYPKSTANEVLNFEDEGAEVYIGNPIHYNEDYSAQAIYKTAVPRARVGSSQLSFPTRIIRSLQGDTNVGFDTGTRTFLESDFLDLTKKRGPLITLNVVDNIIVAHMQRSMMQTKGRQEMTVADARAYIGSGDIFAIAPDEVLSTEEGTAGTQDPKAAIVTPYGYFFVDRNAGKVYLMTDSLNPISEAGLSNFFHDELTDMTEENQLIATYDNKHNRILLTKKGEWTISYFPESQVWESFYSYNPDYYLAGLNTFFALYDDGIYEHNIDEKSGEFNGSAQPSHVELVDNRSPSVTKTMVNLEFITEVEDPDTDEIIYEETFNHFQVKNSYQDSGEQDIAYFTGASGNARHVEGTWKINRFRDMLVDGAIDLNKPWYDQSRFIGKYVQVKLIYNNVDNKFLYLYGVNVGLKESIR